MKNVVAFAAALAIFAAVGFGFASRVGGGSKGIAERRPGVTRVLGGSERAEATRKLESFDSISLPGSGNVRVRIGAEPSVVVRGDSRLLDRADTTVRGTELVLSVRGPQFGPSVDYDVTVPSLKAVRISGSGDVVAEDVLSGKELKLDILGSGSFTGSVHVDALSVDVNGSGDVKIGGTAAEADLEIRGSGDVDARGLDGGRAAVSVMGSGDTRLGTFEALNVRVMGSGDVEYSGDPRVTASTPGSGDVRRR